MSYFQIKKMPLKRISGTLPANSGISQVIHAETYFIARLAVQLKGLNC